MSDHVAGNAHGVNGTGDLTEVGVGMTAGTFDGDTVAVRTNGTLQYAPNFGVINSDKAVNFVSGNKVFRAPNIA